MVSTDTLPNLGGRKAVLFWLTENSTLHPAMRMSATASMLPETAFALKHYDLSSSDDCLQQAMLQGEFRLHVRALPNMGIQNSGGLSSSQLPPRSSEFNIRSRDSVI